MTRPARPVEEQNEDAKGSVKRDGHIHCDKVHSDEHLKGKWMSCNLRMEEIGVEAYFHEVKDRSHYV